MSAGERDGEGQSRRQFLAGVAAAGAAMAWLPAHRVMAGPGGLAPGFPSEIDLYRQAYRNWSGAIEVDGVLTSAPRTPDQVVRIANWGRQAGARIRASGARHGWSPLTITAGSPNPNGVVLVDTRQHLTALELLSTDPGAVRVQTGVSMEALLNFLHAHGLGISNMPSNGDITVGGALAIGAHGAVVPADGEVHQPGTTSGTLSNLVVSLTAVVFDPGLDRYVLRTFERAHADAPAFLTHLGRSFITEVVLRVGPSQQQRCVSQLDVPVSELFAPPESAGARSFAGFLRNAGRVESILFPYTDRPWLKVWSLAPHRPIGARTVGHPYNYLFSDSIPLAAATLVDEIMTGNASATPTFGSVMYQYAVSGLALTDSSDLWGAAKDLGFYIRASTLRVDEFGLGIITSRNNVQRTLHDFFAFYDALRGRWLDRGAYPANMPLELRVSGLDRSSDVAVPGARPPALSKVLPRPDRPEWDSAVWLNVLTFPGTTDVNGFLHELEQWVLARFDGSDGLAVPEWSKGWAFTDEGPWTNTSVLRDHIPALFPDWNWAMRTLDRYDPYRVFSNDFLDRFAVAR